MMMNWGSHIIRIKMHYYKCVDGVNLPFHEIVGKNGNKRATRITDARERGFVPSFSTVAAIQEKPELYDYKIGQVLGAVLEHPYNSAMDPDEWKKEIKVLADAARWESADMGHKIHHSMEYYFNTKEYDENKEYTETAIDLIHAKFPNVKWNAEVIFIHPIGFGGCVDLSGCDEDGNYFIIDFKTKRTTDINKVRPYDDYKMQLAAYRYGLQFPETCQMYNLFISTDKSCKGACGLVEFKDVENRKINSFLALLQYWKIKNDYDSAVNE